uniref:50S ribosomal protein L35 n=1 Tax=Spermothamnion repens TaxID=31383 RepID=A0A4D6X4M1_9FLOR|nr:ribosomal protein L35 [Spermothamnion repens]
MYKFKLKTSKAINKRFKKTATGKFLRHRASRSHLLEKKSSNHKRYLRKVDLVSIKDQKNFVHGLPYSY